MTQTPGPIQKNGADDGRNDNSNDNEDFDKDADRAGEDEDPNDDGAQDPDIKPEHDDRLITWPDDVKPRWQTGSRPKHTL